MSRNNPSHKRYMAARALREGETIAREIAWVKAVWPEGAMVYIGHLPLQSDEVDGWIFKRCRCGFDLGYNTKSGRVWWLRKNHPAVQIVSLTHLLFALSRNCRAHPRWKVPKPAPIKAEVAA